MTEINDPYAYELLTNPLPPGFAELFSGDAAAASTATETTTTEQMDGYLRAIGVLPPLPLPTTQQMDNDPQQAAAGDALVLWMCDFARHLGLGHGTLRRAFSYADRFVSARALVAGADADYQLRLLGAAAVSAAAMYEGRDTVVRRMDATDIARSCGFAASKDVLAMERALLAALGDSYHLGGPAASIAGADSLLLDHLLPLKPSSEAHCMVRVRWCGLHDCM
ncbi:hypothetical protein U9M48_022885 [Paspalum notatum var. saurae]|uniref:Cyclin-like domain-containing protein n=1 Tax=Paspalum notatum var. saurae TaxID=547442 RepID=A0AAQ3WVL2_PASNO